MQNRRRRRHHDHPIDDFLTKVRLRCLEVFLEGQLAFLRRLQRVAHGETPANDATRSGQTPTFLPPPRSGSLAAFLGQHLLAEADLRRGDLDQLVGLDVFEGDFQGQQAGGLEQDVLVRAGGPHVGQLLFLAGVDDHVVVAGVLGDDHALIDVVARAGRTSSPRCWRLSSAKATAWPRTMLTITPLARRGDRRPGTAGSRGSCGA